MRATPIRRVLIRAAFDGHEAHYAKWRLAPMPLPHQARQLLELSATTTHDDEKRLPELLTAARGAGLDGALLRLAGLPIDEIVGPTIEELVAAVLARPLCPFGLTPDELLDAVCPPERAHVLAAGQSGARPLRTHDEARGVRLLEAAS